MSAFLALLFIALVSTLMAIYAVIADLTHRRDCRWIVSERDADIEYLQRQITSLHMDIQALTSQHKQEQTK